MHRVKKTFLNLATLFGLGVGLAACDTDHQAPMPVRAEKGTHATIYAGARKYYAEVSDVKDKLVTVSIRDNQDPTSEPVIVNNYYRGLLAVSGHNRGNWFELDFNEALLEAMFPLAPGKSVSFPATVRLTNSGRSQAVNISLSVLKEKYISLEKVKQKVFVIEVINKPVGANHTTTKRSIAYFAPELSMILKRINKEKSRETYWRVVELDKPGNQQIRKRLRRAGTVAI